MIPVEIREAEKHIWHQETIDHLAYSTKGKYSKYTKD